MKKYKRFTEKRKGKNVIPLLNSVCGVDLPRWCIAEESDIRSYLSGDAVDKFAELEDKIENGTLIELGYHIRKSYKNHDDQRYKIILIDEVEVDKIGYDGLTKAEAEKRLKEQ